MKKHIPNLLSLSRFLVLGIVVWLILKEDARLIIAGIAINNYQLIALIYFVGFITDILDGLLARAWQVESKLGNLLDHVADKVMLLPAFYLLVKHLAGWQLFAYLALEVITIIISLEMLAKGKIKAFIPYWPNWPGKISYVSLAIVTLILLVFRQWEGCWDSFERLTEIILIIGIGLRIWSIAEYFCRRANFKD